MPCKTVSLERNDAVLVLCSPCFFPPRARLHLRCLFSLRRISSSFSALAHLALAHLQHDYCCGSTQSSGCCRCRVVVVGVAVCISLKWIFFKFLAPFFCFRFVILCLSSVLLRPCARWMQQRKRWQRSRDDVWWQQQWRSKCKCSIRASVCAIFAV